MRFFAKIVFTFICIQISLCSALNAVEIAEIQEIRLAKAQLALRDKKENMALKLLAKNMSSKYFHFETYGTLAEYYLEKKMHIKALRVYFYLIGKLGDRRLLRSTSLENTRSILAEIPKVGKSAQSIYFLIGNLFLNLSKDDGSYTEAYREKLLASAYKYYYICSHYNFRTSLVKYRMGLIDAKLNRNVEAIDKFLDVKMLESDGKDESDQRVSAVDYHLADSLLREGQFDAGLIYLRNIYFSPNANANLREYAGYYLDSIATPYSAISFSLGYENDNNIHDLTEGQLDVFESELKEFYLSRSAQFFTKTANIFFSTKKFEHFSFFIRLNADDRTTTDRALAINDIRRIEGNLEIRYDNFIKSVGKLGYSFQKTYTRKQTKSPLSGYSDLHVLTPEYIHTLKRGVISYRLPIRYNKIATGRDTSMDYGLGVDFTLFLDSSYFVPSISIDLTREGALAGFNAATSMRGGISNHFPLREDLSLFLIFGLEKYRSKQREESYSEFSYTGHLSYLFDIVDGLSINASIDRQVKVTEVNNKIKRWLLTSDLSYSF